MILFCFWLLICCNVVLCQDCVTENFENGIEDFTACFTQSKMMLREYSSSNMISPHPRSTKFVTPGSTTSWMSCLVSPSFTITRGGTLEVNRYSTSKNSTDITYVDVVMRVGNTTTFVRDYFSPSRSNFTQGWDTFRMVVSGSGTVEAYLRIQGRDPGSITVIDSYRYISPSYNKDLCQIYTENTTTTTTPTTTITTTKVPQTTTTTQRTTESPTTTTTSDKSTATTTTSTTTTGAPSSSTQVPRFSISLQNKVREFKLVIKKLFK